MQRATPVQMRKSLEIVEAFKKAGLWFVPMPVFDEDDFNSHAAKITEKLEEMERRANLAESIKQIAPSNVCYRQRHVWGGDMNGTMIIGVGGAGCAIAEQLGRTLGHDVLAVNGAGNGLEEKATRHRLCLDMNSRGGRLPTVETSEAAAGEAADEFRKIIAGKQRVIIVAGLGGATGSGAAPKLAGIARALDTHVTAVATFPFSFEKQRRPVAEAALLKLKEHADVVILHDHSTSSSTKNPMPESLNEYFDRIANELGAKLVTSSVGGAA